MKRFCILFFVVGCVGSSPPVPPVAPAAAAVPEIAKPLEPLTVTETPTPVVAVEVVKESPKVQILKEKAAHYLAEARAGAKLLGLGVSVKQARDKSEQITDLYTHLPDVPTDLDLTGEIATRLKNINGSFAVAVEAVKLRDSSAGLGAALLTKIEKQIEKTASDIKGFADEIEAKLGL